jgi:hypothetical protein
MNLDSQDIDELLRLVADARGREIVNDMMLRRQSTTRSVALLGLESKLITMKKEAG